MKRVWAGLLSAVTIVFCSLANAEVKSSIQTTLKNLFTINDVMTTVEYSDDMEAYAVTLQIDIPYQDVEKNKDQWAKLKQNAEEMLISARDFLSFSNEQIPDIYLMLDFAGEKEEGATFEYEILSTEDGIEIVFDCLSGKDLEKDSDEEGGIAAFENLAYEVLIKKTLTLNPILQEIEGDVSYSWYSSNEDVATVSKGKVKGISEGTCKITCEVTAQNGKIYTAVCDVDVLIPLSSIKSDKTSITLPARGAREYTPILSFSPENATRKSVTWESSDDGVAYVNEDGNIVGGYFAGNCTITGTANDGSGKKVKIKVKVPACYIDMDKIEVTEEEGLDVPMVFANGYRIENGRTAPIVPDVYTKSKNFSVSTGYYFSNAGSGWDNVSIIPIKAGNGDLIIETNPFMSRTTKTVTIKSSAIRSKKTYPPMDIDQFCSAPDQHIGEKVSIKGSALNIQDNGLTLACDTDKTKHYFFIDSDGFNLKNEDVYTFYGIVDSFSTYETETGLKYVCPVLTKVTVDK